MKRLLKFAVVAGAGVVVTLWLLRYLEGRRAPQRQPWPDDDEEAEPFDPVSAPPRPAPPPVASAPPPVAWSPPAVATAVPAVEAIATPPTVPTQPLVDEEAILLDALEEEVSEVAEEQPAAEMFVDEGNALFNSGDYERAAERYSRALEGEPTLVSAWYNRANAHTRAGNYDTALDDYNRAIELAPNDPDALNNRGMLHLYRSDYAAALADFSASLALIPGDTTVLVNRGLAHLHGGEATAALADFVEAAGAAPGDAAAHYGAGQAAAMLNDADSAVGHIRRALELDPAYAREAAADSKLASLQGNDAFVELLRGAGVGAD